MHMFFQWAVSHEYKIIFMFIERMNGQKCKIEQSAIYIEFWNM